MLLTSLTLLSLSAIASVAGQNASTSTDSLIASLEVAILGEDVPSVAAGNCSKYQIVYTRPSFAPQVCVLQDVPFMRTCTESNYIHFRMQHLE